MKGLALCRLTFQLVYSYGTVLARGPIGCLHQGSQVDAERDVVGRRRALLDVCDPLVEGHRLVSSRHILNEPVLVGACDVRAAQAQLVVRGTKLDFIQLRAARKWQGSTRRTKLS